MKSHRFKPLPELGCIDEGSVDRKFWTRRGLTAVHDNDVILRTTGFHGFVFLGAFTVTGYLFLPSLGCSWVVLMQKLFGVAFGKANPIGSCAKTFALFLAKCNNQNTRAKCLAYDYVAEC